MSFKIPDEIIEKALECNKDCSCLNGGTELCHVEDCIGNSVHFIIPKNSKSCPYKTKWSFTERCSCSCPVRKEIYNRYYV